MLSLTFILCTILLPLPSHLSLIIDDNRVENGFMFQDKGLMHVLIVKLTTTCQPTYQSQRK